MSKTMDKTTHKQIHKMNRKQRMTAIKYYNELGEDITPSNIRYELYNELKFVTCPIIRKDLMYALIEIVPKYFWFVPASLSGWHEKEMYNTDKGLVRHSKKVGYNCEPLMRYYHYDNESAVWAAALLHDGAKYSLPGACSVNKKKDHGYLMAEMLEKKGLFKKTPEILNAIRNHLYQWGKPPKDLLHPLDYVISMADYLASRGVENYKR